MMEAAEHGFRTNSPQTRRLDRTGLWGVLFEPKVGAGFVVVGDVV